MIGDDEALAAPLSVLGLSVRASNALLISGFSTLKDVVALTEIELWRLPRVGRATLREIESKLSSRGLTLRPGPPRPKWKCSARGFWDTGLNPMPRWRMVEDACHGTPSA
jgi:Bacterial RNA polymerase, alpha chain C terminal domain